MFHGYRVIGVTPYGRHRYVSLLASYLLQAQDILDEHHFWINTETQEDITWLHSCVDAYPSFFRAVSSGIPYAGSLISRIGSFFRLYRGYDNVIFIRFDDDIVWVHPNAIERLLSFRIRFRDYFLVYANTINNSLCTHLHQRMGLFPNLPPIEYECMGNQSWKNWETAKHTHNAFLASVRQRTTEKFQFDRWNLSAYERCSINCICWFGSDMTPVADHVMWDEEQSLACSIPRSMNRINCIAGSSLVSHFAYGPQREQLEAETAILKQYQKIANNLINSI
jgi:hypothetical protein